MKLRKKIPDSQLIDATGVSAHPWLLMAGLCLVGAAKAIEPPFEVFYPPTASPFGAGWSLARFLASSWAIFVVLFMLGGGILGDLYGRRRVLLWGISLMLVSNIALLLSPNTLWHVLWRILAFISAGVVVPLTLAPLYIFFEGRHRATAFSIYLTVVALVGLLSIYHGRLFTQLKDWRGAYLIPTVITIAAIIIIRRSLPESRTVKPRTSQAIFYAGWTILVLGILYAVFELFLVRRWLISILIIDGFVISAGIGLIIWWKQRTKRSSLRKRSSHIRHIIVLILCGIVVQIALLGFYSLTYSYYRVAGNLDFAHTFLSMSPMFLGMLAAVLLIARFWAYQQVRQVVAIGFIVVAFAIAAMAVVVRLPYWVQFFTLALFGIGIIGTKTIWTNAFFQILIDRYIGLNAGVNSATLLVGGALGGVLTTELLARFGRFAFVRQAASLTPSEGVLKSLYDNLSAAISSGEAAGSDNLATTISSGMYALYQDAYTTGYALTILVIALFCLLAAFLIFWGVRATLMYEPEDLPLVGKIGDGGAIPEEITPTDAKPAIQPSSG